MSRSRSIRWSAASLLLVVLCACAGGGGSGGDPPPAPPDVRFDGPTSVDEGQTLEALVSASAPGGAPVELSATGVPRGAAFDPASGRFRWTPDFEQAGAYSVVFTASAASGSASKTVVLTVVDVNRIVLVSVPALVGLTQAEAAAAIAAAGLTPGAVELATSATVPAGSVLGQSPVAGTSVPEGTAVALVVSSGPAMVTVPSVVGLDLVAAERALLEAGLLLGPKTEVHSDTAPAGEVLAQAPAPGSSAPAGSEVSLTVSIGPAPLVPPPDPATVAPPLDATVVTTVAERTAFLYAGASPVQTGVLPGTIEARRAAVIRGRVLTRAGEPLAGARLTVLDHPELGQTVSRTDGMFDLAVNGGGLLTITYEKPGFFPAQRQLQVPWQDFLAAPDVVLVEADASVTAIDLTAATPIQVARGGPVTDERGTRQATLLFSQGTAASLVLPDGSTRPLTGLSVRATEYTVGPSGPLAMPAVLPASTAYTYAVELSVDEAVQAGATDVRFTRPVHVYVDDFIGFPTGTAVPTGYYDRRQGRWIASANGRVVSVLGAAAGLAELDTDGDGASDDAATLAALDLGEDERRALAVLYPSAPKRLWRVAVTHFSAWDCNWPFGPPADAIAPEPPRTRWGLPVNDPCFQNGSLIDCQNQTLGETVPVAGTPFTLNYRSDRVLGNKRHYTLEIPVSGSTVPPSLVHIKLDIAVAGRTFSWTFPAQPNQLHTFQWDGKDAYGRDVQGRQLVTATLSYGYAPVYYPVRSDLENSFGRVQGASGGAIGISGYRSQVLYLSQTWQGAIGGFKARALGLGGWSLDRHHYYDASSRLLYLGTGETRTAEEISLVLGTAAGNGEYRRFGEVPADGVPATKAAMTPKGVAIGPDGTMYVADDGLRRVDPAGTLTTVAGTGAGVKATGPVAVGPAGDVFFVDTSGYSVYRVGSDGAVTRVAGNGTACGGGNAGTLPCGDGGPATQAQLAGYNRGLAVGPDGSLYIAEDRGRVRRVGPDGIIYTIAGKGGGCTYYDPCGDGGLAVQATIPEPEGLAIGPDGSLYIATARRVRRVGTDGVITAFAGNGSSCASSTPCGDGGLATQAQLNDPSSVVVAADGTVYVSDTNANRIRRVDASGVITTVGGSSTQGRSADDAPATDPMFLPGQLALSPSGVLYVIEPPTVRRLAPALPALSSSNIVVASEDGGELYVFESSGRHRITYDALTSVAVEQFGYGSDGKLATVTDRYGNVTTVERDANGDPLAIAAPRGQRTALQVDASGFLASIRNPAGEVIGLTSTDEGLLTGLRDARGNTHAFHYDPLGRLTEDTGPAGSKVLTRTEEHGSYTVAVTTSAGRTARYTVEQVPSGGVRRTSVDASGATTVAVVAADGSRQVTFPDGTTYAATFGPEPRWGMQSPLPRTRTLTVPGRAPATVTFTRQVTLANPEEPFSMTRQTDTLAFGGQSSSTVFDAAARTLTRTSRAGRQTVTTLDAAGRVARVSLGAGLDPIVITRNDRGEVSSVSQGAWSSTYGHDSAGRIVSRADAAGRVTTWAYDEADRVVRTTLPGGETYLVSYDAGGNRTALALPGGASYGVSYDAADRPEALTLPPGGGSYAASYDADGLLTEIRLPGGRAIGRTVDAGGRPAGQRYPEAVADFVHADATQRVSRLAWSPAAGPAQQLDLGYQGELVTSAAWTGPAQGAFAYGYDASLRLSSLALTSGSDAVSVAVATDADGLTTGYGPFTFTRAAGSGLVSTISDGTLAVAYAWDGTADLSTRTHSVASTPRFELGLSYDLSGRISRRTETVDGAVRTYAYVYDPTGQLTEVQRDGTRVETYSYDANGNRTSSARGAGPAEDAAYDALDRLIRRGALAYGFDADGHLASRGGDLFQYSARGELLAASVSTGAVTYGYDALGRRTSRTDGAGTIAYLYGNPGDALQVTAVRDASGALSTLYYDGAGHLVAVARDGERFYVATDQVGSPRLVMDGAGRVVRAIEYDAFGVVTSDSNPGFFLPLGFAGGLADPATGLVRFGFRDYEPAAGRWTSPDPALFGGGRNLYAYVGGYPVGARDPSGLFSLGVKGYTPGGGGGVKVTVTADGFSVCPEIGLGKGAAFEVDPFDLDLDRTGTSVTAELEVGFGPVGVKAGMKLDDRGCPEGIAEAKAGPFQVSTDGVAVEGEPWDAKKTISELFKGGGFKAEGKVAATFCYQRKWW